MIPLLWACIINAQALSETQKQNARATGYAIVAAKNPGVDFTIYMIPWDGVNSLEHNANSQINPSWHAQAAVKGEYFDQTFDNTTFTGYSSVVTSQEEFDKFKSTGTQWWIVCSTLPVYSSHISGKNGNVGIGTINPKEKLDVYGSFRAGTDDRFFIYNGAADIILKDISRGTGGRAIVHDTENKLTLNYLNDFTGGTQLGQSFLVKGTNAILDGKLEAKEVKITNTPTADFVFEENYNLPTLESIEKHIKEKKHLPEVASAKEMQKEGVNIGEFQIKLLQKIEELTLYSIEQNRKIQKLEEKIKSLEK